MQKNGVLLGPALSSSLCAKQYDYRNKGACLFLTFFHFWFFECFETNKIIKTLFVVQQDAQLQDQPGSDEQDVSISRVLVSQVTSASIFQRLKRQTVPHCIFFCCC